MTEALGLAADAGIASPSVIIRAKKKDKSFFM